MAEERVGASFSIDINDLKAGLKTANKLIRESQSEFKKAAAGLDDWTKSEKGLQAKIDSLNSIIPKQEEKVRALKEQYEKLKNSVDENGKAFDETSDRAIELRTNINKEEAALESNKAELEKQEKALKDLGDESDDAGDSLEETGKKAEKSSKGFTVMKAALANLVADGFRKAIDAAKEFVRETVNVGITFEDSIAKVAAVSGATAEEMETLKNKAQEMGSTTKFTASEAAEAFNYMAMAGWKTEDMLGGIEGILNLAAASGSDLATTSDIVTDALTAMGYSAQDAGRLADVMAAASSNANTNVEMMGMTFQYAAPLVGALGYTMEDTALAIGLMANSGIKGEKAGTALRSMFTRLASPPKDCAESLNQLGVSIVDSNGKMKSFDTVMQDLRKAFANLDEVEQATHASHIAGQEAMSGLLAIVNAAPADYDKLTNAIQSSDGAAQNMADTMLDTLGGDMTVLKSQIEGVRLSLYEQFAPTLRDTVQKAQKWLGSVDWKAFGKKAMDVITKIINGAKELGKKILPMLKTAMKVVGNVAQFVIKHFNTLVTVIGTALVVFKAFKAAMAISTAITAVKTAIAGLSAGVGVVTKAQTAWNAAMSANPIGAVITAVALLAAGIAYLTTKTSDSTKELEKEKERLNEVKSAVDENVSSWDSLKTAKQQEVNAGMTELSYYQRLWDELQGIVDQNGKVKEGYENRASFITSQLSEATGIEVDLVNGVITKYQELASEIDNIMEKKKAQIILDAQESLYSEAILKQDEALKEYIKTQKDFEKKQEDLNKIEGELFVERLKRENQTDFVARNTKTRRERNLEDQRTIAEESKNIAEESYNNQKLLVEEYAYNIGLYESNMALAHEGAYDKMSTATWDYVKEFQSAEDVEKAMTEDKIKTTKKQLEVLKNMRTEDNADLIDGQIETAQKQLDELESSMDQYKSTSERYLDLINGVWSDSLDDQLSEITGRKVEFQENAFGLVTMYVDGIQQGKSLSKKEMAKLVGETIKEIDAKDSDANTAGIDLINNFKYGIKDHTAQNNAFTSMSVFGNGIVAKLNEKKSDATTAGENLLDGTKAGIQNQNKQNSVFSAISSFGSTLLSKLKTSLQEKSPSKATEKMGEYLIDGLNIGMKKKEKPALRQISKFGQNVVSAMRNNVNDISNFDGLLDVKSAGVSVSGGAGVNNSRTVTVNQYNTYSQQHSRYELYKSKQETAAAVRLALGTV